MNYFEKALESVLFSDQLYHEEVLEQLNIERDFMISCLENYIILEAETDNNNKKGNWLEAIMNAIKGIFNKFIQVSQELFTNDSDWIKNNIPKLANINYNGLKVETLQYWTVKPEQIMATLNDLQKEISAFKPGDTKLAELQTREDIENYGAFKKYKKRNQSFADSIKAKFKTNEENAPKSIVLENDALKQQCVGEMARYVTTYNTTLLSSLKSTYNNFNRMLKNVERELKSRNALSESFCILENAYYSDTELRFCSNYSSVFEAENEQNNNTQTNNNQNNNTDKKESLNKVQDTSKNNDNNQNNNTQNNNAPKDNSSEYYNYTRIAIQLNQLALTAAMTACEEKYRAYMSILKGVVGARKSK